jgi:hypothetical protein
VIDPLQDNIIVVINDERDHKRWHVAFYHFCASVPEAAPIILDERKGIRIANKRLDDGFHRQIDGSITTEARNTVGKMWPLDD